MKTNVEKTKVIKKVIGKEEKIQVDEESRYFGINGRLKSEIEVKTMAKKA